MSGQKNLEYHKHFWVHILGSTGVMLKNPYVCLGWEREDGAGHDKVLRHLLVKGFSHGWEIESDPGQNTEPGPKEKEKGEVN